MQQKALPMPAPMKAGNVGVAIEVNAETDFVAKNADFQNFVKTCADTVMAQNPADVDALLTCKAADSELTVDELLKEKILTIGENIKIRRFQRFEGTVVSYIHGGGRIGVLVKFETSPEVAAKEGFQEYAKNIAMQVAAINRPIWTRLLFRPTLLSMRRRFSQSR